MKLRISARRASKLQSHLIPIQTATEASRRPLWRGRSRQGRRESSPTRRGGSLINGIGCATCHTSSISDAYAVHHGYFGLDDLLSHNLRIHKSAPSVGARQLWAAKPGLWSKRGKRHLGGHGAEKTLLPATLLLPPLISIHRKERNANGDFHLRTNMGRPSL